MEFGEGRFGSSKRKPFYVKHIAVYLEVIMEEKQQPKEFGIADYGGQPL